MSTALALSSNGTDNKEIGDLLLKVQDELKTLRTKLGSQNEGELDLKALQLSIKRTESELKEKTDSILNSLNSQVAIIPAEREEEPVIYGASLGNLWESSKPKTNQNTSAEERDIETATQHEKAGNLLALRAPAVKDLGHGVSPDQVMISEEIKLINMKAIGMGPTPGQQFKIERETKALFNPENPRNRTALDENYQIGLPLIEKRAAYKMQTHLITGSTIDHLATLPLVYRKNPTLIPPPIPQGEAKHGLYSLIQRGLIPSYAKISFEPEPVVANLMHIKERDSSEVLKHIEYPINVSKPENIYQFDRSYGHDVQKRLNAKPQTPPGKQNFLKKKPTEPSPTKNNLNTQQVAAITNGNPEPPPATPSNALQLQLYDMAKSTHRFIIQQGKTRTDMHEYVSFKQSYCLRWGSIVTIIKYLEDICVEYSINVGFVDGLKVSDLALCLDMDLKPNQEELVDCFLNKEEIEKLIKMPGRRFKKAGGEHLAAVTIQCAWKCYRDRTSYLMFRKRRWAAGIIALTWLTYFKWMKAKKSLRVKRETELENFRDRQAKFRENWPRIKKSKRVIVHIPSLGYSEQIRERMNDLPIREMQQIARLCDIADENVDVIYVSSMQITEETLQYYSKLFGLRAAVVTGDVSSANDVSCRYKIVIPEALDSFPTHNMALSTLLKYSPKALRRIQNLTRGRDAYIVPSVMNIDDLHVSDVLNLPILGSEPEVSNLYTTKSGSKRVFQGAKVAMPYGEFDIYNKDQLYEQLAQAIVDNLHVQRWIFKLDDEFNGRGIAYCDIAKNLNCYKSALKDMIKYGDKWSKRWAHEAIFGKILEELPDLLAKHAKLVNNQLFPEWETFLSVFTVQGGIFEAHPPSDSLTALTVSILIEPDMSARILSSGDHIHAFSEYSCWGLSFPQTSVDPIVLNEECAKIITACKERKIIGYIDIDFVTFIDVKTDKQVLWATDLNISHTEHVSMTSLLLYMTNGAFDWSHAFEVTCSVQKSKKVKGQKFEETSEEKQQRYAVLSAKLYHTNLSVIHYSVFFQTCRALGIGYDIKEKQGTIFSLVDSLNHMNMGMVVVKDNLSTSMQDFARNLTSLHKQISSANMQGETNFNLAANDIKAILDATDDNASQSAAEN